jgi:hypothetical protein
MPIIQYNSGSIIFIKPECYDLGKPVQLDEKEIFVMPTMAVNNKVERNFVFDIDESHDPSSSKQPALPTTPARPRRDSESTVDTLTSMVSIRNLDTNTNNNRHSKSKNMLSRQKDQGMYKLQLVFETTTTFLRIPFSNFARILDDEKKIMKDMADGGYNQTVSY